MAISSFLEGTSAALTNWTMQSFIRRGMSRRQDSEGRGEEKRTGKRKGESGKPWVSEEERQSGKGVSGMEGS